MRQAGNVDRDADNKWFTVNFKAVKWRLSKCAGSSLKWLLAALLRTAIHLCNTAVQTSCLKCC